jgi:hypothetical protein
MPAKQGVEQGRNAQERALKRAPPAAPHSQSFTVLAVAVLGVVYGDIGTSPIYALRECFAGKDPIAITPGNVLGILSLIFWTLVLVISLKYMVYVLRADNRGEGGTFALLALLRPGRDQDRLRRRILILLGLLGASMLYGGAMITPAISVLSAVEGLQVAAPQLHSFVIPITVAILFALFAFQSYGTAKVGGAGRARNSRHPACARGLARRQPLVRGQVLRRQRNDRLPRHVRRVSRHHGRRSALCRSRTLRTPADPQGLVRLRAASATAELLRPGIAANSRAV